MKLVRNICNILVLYIIFLFYQIYRTISQIALNLDGYDGYFVWLLSAKHLNDIGAKTLQKAIIKLVINIYNILVLTKNFCEWCVGII